MTTTPTRGDALFRKNKRPHVIVGLGDSLFGGTTTIQQTVLDVCQSLLGKRFTFVNKGVGGNTTSDMLARFDTDVAPLKPQVVILIGGTNDLATGIPFATTISNYQAIAAKTLALGAEFIICTTPPRNQQSVGLGVPEVRDLNTWIKVWAANMGFRCCDFNSELCDPRTGLYQTGLNLDVVHWNPAGILLGAFRLAALLTHDTPTVEAASLVPVEYSVDSVSVMPASVSYSAQLCRNPLLYPTNFGDGLNYPNDPDYWYSDSHTTVASSSSSGDTTIQVGSKITPGTYRFSTGQVQQETRTVTGVTGSSAPYTATVTTALANPHPVAHTIDRADSVTTLLSPGVDPRFTGYVRKVVCANMGSAWTESIDLWPSASGTWSVGDRLRLIHRLAVDNIVSVPSGSGIEIKLVFNGIGKSAKSVTQWAYAGPPSYAPVRFVDVLIPTGTTSITLTVSINTGTGSADFTFGQLGVYNLTTLGLASIAHEPLTLAV